MGYYTNYSLEWSDDSQTEKIREAIANDHDLLYALGTDGRSGNSCKWYNYANDMLSLSEDFVNVVFTLTGHGEDSGDIWKQQFLNGKTRRVKAEIVFPKFGKFE